MIDFIKELILKIINKFNQFFFVGSTDILPPPLEKEEEIETYMAETRNYDVVLHVKPEKANKIHASVIDGQKCIVIPMEENEQATINGVNTSL